MVRLTPPIPIEGLDTGPATPLDFSRAWLAKAERVRQRRAELIEAGQLDGVAPDSLASLGAALTGRLRIPVIPVRYSNVAPPFPHTFIEERIFGPGRGDSISLAAYWDEVSGGLLQIEGGVTPWVRLKKAGSHYLRKEEYGWANFGRAHDLVRDALRAADRLIDFTGFDNDGPDGVPNSGDDDGFADLVVILYAVPCEGEWREGAIWPHRGAIRPFQTDAKSANGGRIRVSDYLILPVQEPGTCEPLQVGVLAHETGHALGLPDLYDFDGTASGAGAWDLMGNGSHNALHSPAHPSAWSKEQLGWVRVDWIEPGQDSLRLAPVVRERTVLRYDLPGPRGEYLLLENRQRIGSDSYLPGTGLLAWRVDPERAALGAWNGIGRYRGVELVRAGNASSFPGPTRHDHLDLGPEARFSLSQIRQEWGGDIAARVTTGYTDPTLVASDPVRITVLPGDTAHTRAIVIRTEGGAPGTWSPVTTAPWAEVERRGNLLLVTADPTGLQQGIYTDTVHFEIPASHTDAPQGTEPGPDATFEIHLEVADPDSSAVVGEDLPWGWGLAVDRGRIFQASFGRDALSLRPRPRLLRLPGREHGVETLTRIQETEAVYAPVVGPHGSVYLIGQGDGRNHIFNVDDAGRTRLIASLPGTAPAYGAAGLEDGRLLVADWTGKIVQVTSDGRVAPWIELGRNVYQITVAADGALYAAAHNGNLLRFDPGTGKLTTIPTGFGTSRLVALTAAPDGSVFAGERGGAGRILRVTPDGARTEVARIGGAEFYGLATDTRFLYALDLGHRQILRFPLEALGQPPATRESALTSRAPPPPPRRAAGP